ncbi:Rsd/AlgQ family anti-sigma factor [Methylomagnum sp.]
MAESIQERREQTRHIVGELLTERQQVWTLYCAIGEMQPFSAGEGLDSKLRDFCQLLIDYISLGHFGIYQRIHDGTERRQRVREVAEQIYDRIAEATDAAVAFNDKYENLSGDEVSAHLAEDLSRLGEELATRNDLEDQLLAAMTS